jgi:hypothetical protein
MSVYVGIDVHASVPRWRWSKSGRPEAVTRFWHFTGPLLRVRMVVLNGWHDAERDCPLAVRRRSAACVIRPARQAISL